ncbi:hypothetical protein I2W78_22520 [Streptomyces spinoverrucosus]|uniref:hypothetical protein n=1 Tax=Streptomyces spinoverrucosus TaxID=284043 RepID=UPI0018C3654A|nr:hypothetical protein [Streptomyces spinoverrucosus]MBG0854541.1 hypothetical protein [Streptomyces spinoverrucosus]
MDEAQAAGGRTALARSRALWVLGPVLALMVTACGGGDSDASGSAVTPPTDKGKAKPSTSQSSPATPSPTPTPTPTRKEARDGRNFEACLDRTCEVEVRDGDVIRFAPKFISETFTVDRVTDEKVEFSATDDQPSPLRGWVGGTGTVETGDIHVDFDRPDDERVILKFSPRRDD